MEKEDQDYVLYETYHRLLESNIVEPKIDSIFLTNFGHVVKLLDGSIGYATNYAKLETNQIDHLLTEFYSKLQQHNDVKFLFEPGFYFRCLKTQNNSAIFLSSLRVAVLNALTANQWDYVLSKKFDVHYGYKLKINFDNKIVLLIGFGGYLEYFLSNTDIKTLNISDIRFDSMEQRFESQFGYKHKKIITLGNESFGLKNVNAADVVCITASTLCNGTFKKIMDLTSPKQYVILQGASCAFEPTSIFEQGVDLISTSLPSKLASKAAQIDRSGYSLSCIAENIRKPLLISKLFENQDQNSELDSLSLENGYSRYPKLIYQRLSEYVVSSGAILELGSGNGLFLKHLIENNLKLNINATGVDNNGNLVNHGNNEILLNINAKLIKMDIRDFDIKKEVYDYIFTNPIYFNPGYYNQRFGTLSYLINDNSIENIARKCVDGLSSRGMIVFWCYRNQIQQLDQFTNIIRDNLKKFSFVESSNNEAGIHTWIYKK